MAVYMLLIPPRDELVSRAVGRVSCGGVTYSTTAQNITDLLPVGSAGVNHGTPVDAPFVIFPKTDLRSRHCSRWYLDALDGDHRLMAFVVFIILVLLGLVV